MTVGRSDWGGVLKNFLGGSSFPSTWGGNRIFGPGGGVRGEYKGNFFLAAFGGQNFAFLRLKVKIFAAFGGKNGLGGG